MDEPARPTAPRSAEAEIAAGTTLRRRAVRGLKITGVATGLKTVVDLGAQLLLARLLIPEHFGVFAMAQALTGFVSCFSDMAGQKYLVHLGPDRTTPRAVSTLFWFELFIGIMVAMLWVLAAPHLLTAMGRPDQIPFAQVLSLWIVFERLMLPRAILDARLAFGRSNMALLTGTILGAMAALYAATAGWGPWAFVLLLLVRTGSAAAMVWWGSRWWPRITLDRDLVRRLLPFGVPLLLTNALVFAYTNVDYLIVGQMLGYEMLGLYWAAYRYPHYLNQFSVMLSSVLFPSFSRARNDDAQMTRGLGYLTRYCAGFAFLPMVLTLFHAEFLIRWLLQEQWLPAAFAFRCFTVLAAFRLVFRHWGDVAVAKGVTRLHLQISLFNFAAVTTAAWVGARWWGIDGAAALVTATATGTLLFCCAMWTPRFLPQFRYFQALLPAIVAVGCCALSQALLRWLVPQTELNQLLSLLLGGLIYMIVFAAQTHRELRRLWRNR